MALDASKAKQELRIIVHPFVIRTARHMEDEPTRRYAASASGLPCSTGCSPPLGARGCFPQGSVPLPSSCSSSYQSWWDRSDQPSVLAHRGLLRKGRPAWTYFVWLEMNGPLDRWHARQFGPGTTPRYRVPAAFIALKITRSFKNSSAAHEKNRCTTSPFSLDREQGSDRLPLALSLHWITTSVLSLVP